MTERDPEQTQPQTIEPEPAVAPTAADLPRASDVHIEDPNGQPAPTAQVARTGSGGSARRWGIALVVVALVIAAGAAVAILLGGSSTPSAIVAYAPNDAVTYASARLDLPGDQRQNVGQLLSKFPGFADQSTLDQKVGEVLDRLVSDATNGEQTYTTDIEPWFGGEVGVAIGRLPDPPSAGGSLDDTGSMLALVSVSDATAARAWFDEAVAGEETSTSTHGGVELVLVGREPRGAMGIVGGRVMLLGDEASVKAAIDSNGQGGLDANAQYVEAQSAFSGDHLGAFYVDSAAYVDWLGRVATEMPDAVPGLGLTGMTDIPAWAAGRLRAEGDALVFDIAVPHAEGVPARTNRVSDIASRVPATTLAVVDIHDVGAALDELVEGARSDPATADAFRDIESAVALFGGFEGLIGWIGDAGFVIVGEGTDLGGGLVVAATDGEGAEQFAATIGGLLALAGGEIGISTRAEDHNGTTITFIDVGEAAGQLGGVEGGVPEIGWAVQGDVFVLGVGESFITSVLDTTPATSLAESDRYRDLVDRAGRENVTSAWMDLVELRGVIEAFGAQEPGGLGAYEQDVKPYLEPFDALVSASVAGEGLDRTTVIMSVR